MPKVYTSGSFLIFTFSAFQNNRNLLYLKLMEKSIKLKKIKRKRKHGFFERSRSHGGQKVLKNRRAKKRKTLTV